MDRQVAAAAAVAVGASTLFILFIYERSLVVSYCIRSKSAKVKTVNVWKCPKCGKFTELQQDECHNCGEDRPKNLH